MVRRVRLMDDMQIYTNSYNELTKARNLQLQVSQKELELELLEINIRYNIGGDSDFAVRLKRRTITNEIDNLIYQRNSCINRAIDWALELIETELNDSRNSIISLGGQAIGSINSFISSQKVELRLSISSHMKLSQVSSKLLFSGIGAMSVRSEIDGLKRLLKAY